MTQFYVVEVRQHANGEYSHDVHYTWDEDPVTAQLKGESKFEVLAAAAVSEHPVHSAILFGTDCVALMAKSFKHST